MRGFSRMLAAQTTLIVFVVGALVAFSGLWWLSPPWALVLGGALLMLMAVGAELYGVRNP